MIVYSDRGCPFLHRIAAVATYLGRAFEARLIPHDRPSDELLSLSPSGRIPLARFGDVVLHESTVICDYLAEEHSWRDAYPVASVDRARHRLAVRQLDDVLMREFVAHRRAGAVPTVRLDEALDQLAEAWTSSATTSTCMLTLSAGPMWLLWTKSTSWPALTERVGARTELVSFFELAASLPSVAATYDRGTVDALAE